MIVRVVLGTVALMIISGGCGALGGWTYVRLAARTVPKERHTVVMSGPTDQAVLTDSESATLAAGDALTEQLIAQPLPIHRPTTPTGLQAERTCRWCSEQGSTVTFRSAGDRWIHGLRCPGRPKYPTADPAPAARRPGEGRHRVRRVQRDSGSAESRASVS